MELDHMRLNLFFCNYIVLWCFLKEPPSALRKQHRPSQLLHIRWNTAKLKIWSWRERSDCWDRNDYSPLPPTSFPFPLTHNRWQLFNLMSHLYFFPWCERLTCFSAIALPFWLRTSSQLNFSWRRYILASKITEMWS